MRKVIALCICYFTIIALHAQQSNPKKISVLTGKNILDSLPGSMQGNSRNAQHDKVFDASNLIGVIVHRDYGTVNRISIEVIDNSPSVTNVSTTITKPPTNTAIYTVTQIKGYKALVQQLSSEVGKTGYELLMPVNNSLIAFKAYGYTQDQFLTMANTIPVAMIARKVK